MKVWLLYSMNYDNCNVWPELLSIHSTEESCIEAQILEEEKEKYIKWKEHNWTDIDEWDVK